MFGCFLLWFRSFSASIFVSLIIIIFFATISMQFQWAFVQFFFFFWNHLTLIFEMIRNWTWRTRRRNRWVGRYPTVRHQWPPHTNGYCRWNRAKFRNDLLRTKRCWMWSNRRSPTTRWMSFWRSCSAGSNSIKTSCSSTRSCARRLQHPAVVKVHQTRHQMSSWRRSSWSSPTDANRLIAINYFNSIG